jgi:hypothetical protein
MGTMTAPGHSQRLTFPLSSEYTKWKVPDGLREIIANALDEDAHPDVRWDPDERALVVEDSGPGLPRQGLALGMSRDTRKGGRKGVHQIGQFGEGLNLASLVMARSHVPMRVETVGYGFEPVLVHDPNLDCEVLALDFFSTERSHGTRVVVHCQRAQADAAMAKFLSLDINYMQPQEPGRMVLGESGAVYVGGVRVNEAKDLFFSYDFPLESKRLQNRDRTVIDGWALTQMIGDVLRNQTDPPVVRRLIDAAMQGRLSDKESAFVAQAPSPAMARAMSQIGADMFAGQSVCWAERGDEEALLDLNDRGYKAINSGLTPSWHAKLMKLLGVKRATELVRKPPKRQVTQWVKDSRLTEQEKSVLDRSVDMVRRVFGSESVGQVAVYSETRYDGVDNHLAFGGFYQPQTGKIAIQRDNLRDASYALEVLYHETGHRRRHRVAHRSDYGDRSRGFESELVSMGTQLLTLLEQADALPSQYEIEGETEESGCNRASRDMRELVRCRMRDLGIAGTGELARMSGVSIGMVRQVAQLSASPSVRTPGLAISCEQARAVADVLDLRWYVLMLCLQSPGLVTRKRNRAGKLCGVFGETMIEANTALSDAGDHERAWTVDQYIYGRVEITATDVDSWISVYGDMISEERNRLDLKGETA